MGLYGCFFDLSCEPFRGYDFDFCFGCGVQLSGCSDVWVGSGEWSECALSVGGVAALIVLSDVACSGVEHGLSYFFFVTVWYED